MKDFGSSGRDVNGGDHILNESLSDVKILLTIVKMMPDAKPIFLELIMFHLPREPRSRYNSWFFKHKEQGILASVDPRGVMTALPVVCQRQTSRSFRHCADFEVHVNDKIKTEDYPLTEMVKLFHGLERSKFYVKIDLSPALPESC